MELGNILPFFKGLKKITNTTFGKGRKSEVKNPFFLEGNSSVNLLCALSNQKPNATNRLKKKRNDRSGSGSVCESSGSSAFDEMLQSSFTIRLESTVGFFFLSFLFSFFLGLDSRSLEPDTSPSCSFTA